MTTTTKPFLSLTAAELMSTSVVAVPLEMSLQGAARRLSQAGVTGAPVVDADGRCVGVLSATDFVSWVEGRRPGAEHRRHEESFHSAWQVPDAEALPRDSVERYMTADPVVVPPTTSIEELARKMVDGHIHRVVVVDVDHRPVGIVSSYDVLAAVAHGSRRAGLS